MAAQPAYGYPATDPAFVNGEYKIAVSDPITAAGVATYRIARWIDIPEGVYKLKALATGNAVLRIGADLAGLTTLVSLTADVLTNTSVYFTGGKVRFDIELPHTDAGQECSICFLLYLPDKVVYASSAVDWMFDITAPLDAELIGETDSRRSLSVFSIQPNWKNGITERVEYLTNSLMSETGSEQTRALRESPRRYFDAQFQRRDTRRSRLDAFLTAVGRRTFMLPLWHEQYRPAGGLGTGVGTLVFPAGTLALREFRAGDLVFVNSGNPDDFDVLEVGSLDTGTDTLTWVDAPTRDWQDGTRIIPMRKAMISDKSTMRNPINQAGSVGLRFTVMEDDVIVGESWGASNQVWPFDLDWSDAVQQEHDRIFFVQDNDIAIPSVAYPQDRAEVTTRFSAWFRGRSQMRVIRQFIAAARGRTKRFWLPSMMRDVTPTANLSGTTFDALPFGFAEYAGVQQEARRFLEFVKTDGTVFYREITDILGVGSPITAERFTVSVALPATPLSEISMIRFIMPVRFQQDGFEFHHHVDESRVVTTSFVITSSDSDGLTALPA